MYCNICNKDRKLKKAKISKIKKQTLSPSIVYSKCDHKYEKIFKEEESIEILKKFFFRKRAFFFTCSSLFL